MKILFLYTELADYTLACLKALKKAKENPDIMVIHYPVNPEAPFNFDFGLTGIFKNIRQFGTYIEFKRCIDAFHPDKILVSGWSNKWYVHLCTVYRKKAVCILTMDNHWRGSLKQRIFVPIFRLTLKYVFKKIWIPGAPQLVYAKKLGFKDSEIMQGFYSCDVDFYSDKGKSVLFSKCQDFPKRLICIARYIPAKNYATLWEAFIQWKEKSCNDWELWCAGSGEQFDQRRLHSNIHHIGFVQKESWNEVIAQTGIFILPSEFEPWAVAVHEFASAGYPLILSSKVGAATTFLDKKNGWVFNPFNIEELINIFKELETLSPGILCAMGRESMKAAQKITPVSWATFLLEC